MHHNLKLMNFIRDLQLKLLQRLIFFLQEPGFATTLLQLHTLLLPIIPLNNCVHSKVERIANCEVQNHTSIRKTQQGKGMAMTHTLAIQQDPVAP